MRKGVIGFLGTHTSQRASLAVSVKHAGSVRAHLFVFPPPHVDKMSRDCGGCGHCRTNQMGAATATLPSFEVAIAGRSAALYWLQNVRVHAETHRTFLVAPL